MYNAEIFLNNKLRVRCLTILIVFQEEDGRMELTPHIDVIENANDLNYNKSTRGRISKGEKESASGRNLGHAEV